MKTSSRCLRVLAGFFLAVQLTGLADPIIWQPSRALAVDTARNRGKLILLLAGRDTCGNCQFMKNTVCETPSIRVVIDANYVCWFCPVDSSTEWYPYASGLGSFTLPLMCVIDPGDPTAYLDRSTSTQSLPAFENRLKSHLPTQPIALTLIRTTPSRLQWLTESDLRFRVLRSVDLGHWDFVGGLVLGDGSPIEFHDSPTADRVFYRVLGFR